MQQTYCTESDCINRMSDFEQERYGMCGFCHEAKAAAQQAHMNLVRAVRLWEYEEKKRWAAIELEAKTRREKQAKEDKIAAVKQAYANKLKRLVGKTIESVDIEEWQHILNDWWEPKRIAIYTEDGSFVRLSQEEHADGCRGCYDYYHYLEADVHIEPTAK